MIEFHVKSIQSDIDGRHFDNWNGEASQIWKEIFREISAMEDSERTEALELIREQWMDYLKHYDLITKKYFQLINILKEY